MPVILKKICFSDSIANLFIKRALLIRGSKRLFESKDEAEKYLVSLKGRPETVACPRSGKCTVKEFMCGSMQCFSFAPPQKNGKKIIYLPGGALVRQPTAMHYRFVEKTALLTGSEIIVCVYPKAPEHTYVESLSAVGELYGELLKECSAKNITVMGDSAGGTLAVLLPSFLVENGLPVFGKAILFSPMLTVSPSADDVGDIVKKDPMLGIDGLRLFVDAWCGEKNDRNDPEKVLAEHLPDTYIFCGENDILTFYSTRFSSRAAECGKSVELTVYEKLYHVFPLFSLRASKEVIDRTVQIIKNNQK